MKRFLKTALPATLFVGAIALWAPQQATAAHPPYGSSSSFYRSPGYSRVVVVSNPYARVRYYGRAPYVARHHYGVVPHFVPFNHHGGHHGYDSHRRRVTSHHGSYGRGGHRGSGHHGSGLHIGFGW